MKKILLNLYFWPVFVLLSLLGIGLLPFILLAGRIILRRNIAHSLRLAIGLYGRILVRGVVFMAPVKVYGRLYDIPRPAIFIANHNSAIDPYLFGAIPGEHCFVTSWPFKIPIYGPLMKLAGYINISDGWDTLRQKCRQRLEKGVSVIIWPEGHRSRNGKIGRFRKGAFQLAVETGYPIQPVCIFGSGDVLLPGERFLSPGRVRLRLLAPIYPARKGDLQTRTLELRRQSFEAIERCLAEYGPDSGYPACSLLTPQKGV